MRNQALFRSSFVCECGRVHSCPIENVIIKSGAVNEAAEALTGFQTAIIVSDRNTRPLAIEPLINGLKAAGIMYEEVYYDSEGILIPNEDALEKLTKTVQLQLDFEKAKETLAIIGIGSGVINDICKQVSFEQGLPYMIIATAPSMDGYASNVSALILKGMKATLTARPPRWIIGDTQILKDAPVDMIRAGMGDILGKFSCLNDWKLAVLITGEHFCQTIYDMTKKEAVLCAENIEKCLSHDEEAIGGLMTSLVMVGVAMAYMGNSRPASGCEHHISHFFEVTGVAFHKPYLAHGIDVAYSTILTMRLREMLVKEDPSVFRYSFDQAQFEDSIRRVYGPLAEEVLELQNRSEMYKDRLDVISARWGEIVEILKDAPTGEEMTEMLKRAGYDWEAFVSFYGKDRILDAAMYAKDVRARYTVVWLLQNAGLLGKYAKEAVE